MNTPRIRPALLLTLLLAGCGGGAPSDPAATAPPPAAQLATTPPAPPPPADALDQRLRGLIDQQGLTGDPLRGRDIPAIDSPLAQLGMRLFFSKSLGGELDAACASCHHPALGGADALSLPVGIDARNPALLGPGRVHASGVPNVPRHSPTTFNVAIFDRVLFHDGRIESLAPRAGANGAGGPIRTPDSAFGQPDPAAGATLPAAQARFPVTSEPEMRGVLLPGAGNTAVRDRLAARIGNYGAGAGELVPNRWLPLFQEAYGVAANAQSLVTYANIAEAIAAYERSQAFADNAWNRYAAGDNAALTVAAKRGATLFLSPPDQGGAGCGGCHRGDRFSDETFQTVAFPMIGPGKGDGPRGTDDFGRERESGDPADRYAFRVPTLLNVALTAPYGHAGSYATLREVVRHYVNPRGTVDAFFARVGACSLAQFAALPAEQCAALYPDAQANSNAALDKLAADRRAGRSRLPPIRLDNAQVDDLVAFLQSLTDRCAADRACLARWIPPAAAAPDAQQLDAVNARGDTL